MIRSASPILATMLAVAATQPCLAGESPWTGAWLLDAANSRRTGAITLIATTADGTVGVTTAGLSFHFRCDDKDYPLPGGRVIACRALSATQWRLTGKQNGDVLAQTLRTLSDAGKTMTAEVTGKSANGASFRKVTVLRKLSGGTGWDGTWQDSAVDDSSPDRMIVNGADGAITFIYPDQGATLSARLDGSPAEQHGAHVAQGDVFSLTANGPNRIVELETVNGVAVEHDTLNLDADGKTLTVEALRTGDNTPQILVYRREAMPGEK